MHSILSLFFSHSSSSTYFFIIVNDDGEEECKLPEKSVESASSEHEPIESKSILRSIVLFILFKLFLSLSSICFCNYCRYRVFNSFIEKKKKKFFISFLLKISLKRCKSVARRRNKKLVNECFFLHKKK